MTFEPFRYEPDPAAQPGWQGWWAAWCSIFAPPPARRIELPPLPPPLTADEMQRRAWQRTFDSLQKSIDAAAAQHQAQRDE